jgi:hypothetical protein
VDVGVLVLPVTPAESRIAIAYRTRVDHNRVRREVARLAQAFGGQIRGELRIRDESLRPNELRDYPVTTGAEFTLTGVSQVQDNAPVLLPYLVGFQSWNRIEVIFALPDLQPYRGVQPFDSEALSVQLVKEEGAYRYLAEIRRHEGALPVLPTSSALPEAISSPVASAEVPRPAARPESSPLPQMLVLTGSGLLVGAGLYFLYLRRAQSRLPIRGARNIRH